MGGLKNQFTLNRVKLSLHLTETLMDTVVHERVSLVIGPAGKLLVKLQSFAVLSPQGKSQTNRNKEQESDPKEH